MSLRVLAVAALLLPVQALAVDLDAFAPATCADLDRQLAQGSEVVAAFNATSRDAVAALRAGRTAEGCPALREALGFATHASEKLAACVGEVQDGAALLAGFKDLRRQIESIGRRETCLGTPGS